MKLGNLDITLKLGSADVSAAYLGSTLVYSGGTPPTPTGSTCYEIISTPITSYTSTTYDSVYSFSDSKWYMLNNLNAYEEYGVYDIVENISSATTYEGKLGVVGETEYQYSGGSWSVVGSYVDSSVTTYTIDDTSPSPYVGQELLTTFKIPYADVELIGFVDLRISTNDGDELQIIFDNVEMAEYSYEGNGFYQGTVTNDGEYFYLSLPSEAPQSIVIDSVEYLRPEPIHLIVGSKQASVEYVEKATPSYSIYSTVQEMEAVGCPTVGINEYAFVGNDLYKYFANEEWNGVTYFEPKMVAFYENEDPLIQYANNNSTLEQSETKIIDISPISVYIGDCVTTIGNQAFAQCRNLASVTLGSGLTSIGNNAFSYCSGLTSVTIPDSVTSIGEVAFYGCSILTSITIPSGVTSIGGGAFNTCSGLTSITCFATTPPSLGKRVFDNTNNCQIYVPSGSVDTYKSANRWSDYADRIQSIADD